MSGFEPKTAGWRTKGSAGQTVNGALVVSGGITAGGNVVVTGSVDATLGVTGQRKFFPEILEAQSGPVTLTAGLAIARYLGQAPKNFTSCDAQFYVHGVAAAGAGYAEIALASGPIPTQLVASLSLTALAYASIDTEVKIAATVLYNKALSGFAMTRDLGMWLILGCSYATTQASFRFGTSTSIDVNAQVRTRAAYQPSANIGTARTFSYAIGTQYPIARLQLQ